MSGGNRARFVPSQSLQITPSTSSNVADIPGHRTDASTVPRTISTSFEPNTGSTSLAVSLISSSKRNSDIDASKSPRPSSDCSDDEIIAQRTRTTETETLYKAKKERQGKLNVSGFMKNKDTETKSIAPMAQSATIQEVLEHEELEARSPRQYSSNKLISKTNSPSVSGPSHFAPPSTQIAHASSKMPSSRQPLHLDAPTPDHFRNKQLQSTTRSDPNDPHTSTRSSNDEKIKGLTSAFNRKRSTVSRPTPPRYASPIRNTSHAANGRFLLPNVGPDEAFVESAASRQTHRQRNERDDFDMEQDGDELEEDSYQVVDRRSGDGMKEIHLQRELIREKRGEKRVGGSDVEDVYASTQAGKRARTETYEELQSSHDADFHMSLSPDLELESEIGQHKNDANHSRHADAQNRPDGRHPQLNFFLGQDVDEYISAHMDRYEASKKRWAECSRDEWERGADELVGKFTEVLDFVKDHVKRKVTLFASLHTKIDEHQKEREETAEMLKEARRKLVAKTGIVVDEGQPTG